MANAAEPALKLDVPLDVEKSAGAELGRGALSRRAANRGARHRPILAALARGGRINFFGFVLALLARLPFLFIAGRMYGAEQLGRFAYAVLIVEFAAQLATLGLKRGLAQQLAKTDKPHVCVVADALLVAAIGSAIAMTILALFPQAMFPNSEITGMEWALPITDLRAGLVGHLPRPRWPIAMTSARRCGRGRSSSPGPSRSSPSAGIFISEPRRPDHRLRAVDGRGADRLGHPVREKLWPAARLEPDPGTLWRLARRNLPVAAADAVEWGSRRVDIAVLGLFFSPADRRHLLCRAAGRLAAGQAQDQLRPDPRAGDQPNLAEGDKVAVAKQVRQVGFWVIAAQGGWRWRSAFPARR